MAPPGLKGSGNFKLGTRCTQKLHNETISLLKKVLNHTRAVDSPQTHPAGIQLSPLQTKQYACMSLKKTHDVNLMRRSRGAGTLAAPWALALLLLGLAASCQLAAAGDIISSSKLESCIADGSQVWFPEVPMLVGSSSSSATAHTQQRSCEQRTADAARGFRRSAVHCLSNNSNLMGPSAASLPLIGSCVRPHSHAYVSAASASAAYAAGHECYLHRVCPEADCNSHS